MSSLFEGWLDEIRLLRAQDDGTESTIDAAKSTITAVCQEAGIVPDVFVMKSMALTIVACQAVLAAVDIDQDDPALMGLTVLNVMGALSAALVDRIDEGGMPRG